jgi:hypothetical protein
MILLRLILCGKSIARISNASLTLNQGIGVCVLKRKSKFDFLPENDFLRGNPLSAFLMLENASQILIQEFFPRFRKVIVYIKAKNTNLHTYFPQESGKAFSSIGNAHNRFPAV